MKTKLKTQIVNLWIYGSRAECETFVEWLNSIMPGIIQLKCNFSEDSLEFLDLKIMIKNGKLETELYVNCFRGDKSRN